MAYTTLANNTGDASAWSLRSLVDAVRKALRHRAEYRRTYRALQTLSNRELADIGVRRSDICDIARLHTHIN